ncbi:MAG: hypothetical protein A2086_12585 [Spirochaetes bacterium GWD1_27_9]|nr:MAG: hypothetical protein A2Z98_10865 [Spirochaetes bacterium GWB1_27_13]OHD23467.1 MAG: hypothetical protein A2Y34_14140 [Spirochaetes bacterium GWC1_27_15]OHD44295.1 MAG: hypothetical protein A2086_12585 [Spirochaetes bacterium GWD1_27_9]
MRFTQTFLQSLNFYISIICIILFFILIILSVFNNYKIDFNKYIYNLYFIVPMALLYTISDGFNYFIDNIYKKSIDNYK